MEKEKFEDKWRDAFRDASVSPSDAVWTNIELDLATAEHQRLEKRLFYYKLMAAASVIFALFAGVVSYYQFNDTQEYQAELRQQKLEIERLIAEKNDVESKRESQKFIAEAEPSSTTETQSLESRASKQSSEQKKRRVGISSGTSETKLVEENESGGASETAEVIFDTDSESLIHSNVSNAGLPSLVAMPKPALRIPEQKKESVDPVQEMMARLAEREKALAQAEQNQRNKQENANEKLWTSIGVAGGSFSSSGTSISPTSSNQAIQFNNNIADDEASAAGYTYAVGMNMGTRIASRWVVQGGLNYLTQTSDYTAQAAVGTSNLQSFKPASINELQRFDTKSAVQEDKKLIATAPYNINNSVRYLTIPLQAGYMVIDNKFGLQLNAGFSTDLFLSNVKTAEGGSLDNTKEDVGDESPYRTTNFSGLVGTELSYRFGERYRFALNPGLRYPLNSVYKDEVGVDSAPISFDLGLRFRYIFK